MSNVNVILSTAYLPPIDYFRVIKENPGWQLEQHENYIKQSYRNRCHIYSANGLLPLQIPVSRKEGSSAPVRRISIDNSENWQVKHWRAIVSAYNSTPFFEYYKEDFIPFYFERYDSLFDFNTSLLKLLLELTGLDQNILLTGSFSNYESDSDYRTFIHPKKRSPVPENKEKGRYHQVFAHKYGFIPNLSLIDLLFNEGPDSILYL